MRIVKLTRSNNKCKLRSDATNIRVTGVSKDAVGYKLISPLYPTPINELSMVPSKQNLIDNMVVSTMSNFDNNPLIKVGDIKRPIFFMVTLDNTNTLELTYLENNLDSINIGIGS